MHDALLSPTVAQSEDSDNALESPYSYFNKHGVEIHWLTHKPLCCVTCAFFDLADVGEDEWPVPFCQRGVFMPVRKGTCVTRRPPALAAVPTEARS